MLKKKFLTRRLTLAIESTFLKSAKDEISVIDASDEMQNLSVIFIKTKELAHLLRSSY